jgi:hypothetical protein
MNINEAIQYFGSGYELCKKLEIKSQNFYKWKKADWIPLKQQHKINDLIGGILPIDIDKEALNERLKLSKSVK